MRKCLADTAGTQNCRGRDIVDFAMSCELVIGNTCFEVTQSPDPLLRQVEQVLRSTTCSFEKLSASIWVMSRLNLARRSPSNNICWISDFCSGIPPTLITSFVPRLGTWCLREQDDHSEYQRLVAARQKRSGERWSPVRWRQLKTRVGFSRNSSREKTGDRVRLFIVQSRKSWDAKKNWEKVAAWRNIRRPSGWSNILLYLEKSLEE